MKPAGTTPAGIHGEEQTARWVREMFSGVAGRYDLLNHVLSLNIDKYWRSRTVSHLREILLKPGVQALDLCCGTGDLLVALENAAGKRLYGSDFCHPMLTGAKEKLAKKQLRSVVFE